MPLSLFDAMKKVASDFIVSATSSTLRNHDLPEHQDQEFLGPLGFNAPAKGASVAVQDARQGIQDVLKGNISLTSNQHEEARFAIYQGEAWGVSTEVDFITGTIKYRWAFKSDFDSKHYEILIFRSEGSDFPDDYPFRHGDTTPFVQTHLKEGEQNLDSRSGATYAHTAVLRDRRTGKGADPLRFVTKVYSMEDWESLNSAASRLKNEVPKKASRSPNAAGEKQKIREAEIQKVKEENYLELGRIESRKAEGLIDQATYEAEREKALLRYHDRMKRYL